MVAPDADADDPGAEIGELLQVIEALTSAVDEQSHPWPRAESILLTAHVPGHDRNAPPLLAAAGPRAAQSWASRPNLGQWLGFCVNTGLLPGEATPGPAEILLLQALPSGLLATPVDVVTAFELWAALAAAELGGRERAEVTAILGRAYDEAVNHEFLSANPLTRPAEN